MSVQCSVTARAQVLGLSRNSTVITMVPLQLQAQHYTTYLSVYDTSQNSYRYQFSKKYMMLLCKSH